MLGVALVRGINVGGITIRSVELASLFEACGLAPCRVLLQSGNAVFELGGVAATEVENLLQERSSKLFGRDLPWFVRTKSEWLEIVEHNPFPDFAEEDPSHLLVHFSKTAFDSVAVKELCSGWEGPESFEAIGRELYAMFPDGIGTSKLFKDRRWLKLTSESTGRNWNTLIKLKNLLATGL